MEADKLNMIEDYVDAHTDDVSFLLEALMAETEKITGRSFWSIGKVEGKLLQLLIKISRNQPGRGSGYLYRLFRPGHRRSPAGRRHPDNLRKQSGVCRHRPAVF